MTAVFSVTVEEARAAAARAVGRSGAPLGGAKWGVGAGAAADAVLPPLCPTPLTCIFLAEVERKAPLGRLTVEECGVEWGAVE
jgi:hypothetical protein